MVKVTKKIHEIFLRDNQTRKWTRKVVWIDLSRIQNAFNLGVQNHAFLDVASTNAHNCSLLQLDPKW